MLRNLNLRYLGIRKEGIVFIISASLAGPARLQVGLQSESGYPHKGKLDYTAPIVNPTTGALAARASLANGDRYLLPDYSVRVRIPLMVGPALLVPNVALGGVRTDPTDYLAALRAVPLFGLSSETTWRK